MTRQRSPGTLRRRRRGLLTPRIVRTHRLTQEDVGPIHIGTRSNPGMTGPPPRIAPQPDAGP